MSRRFSVPGTASAIVIILVVIMTSLGLSAMVRAESSTYLEGDLIIQLNVEKSASSLEADFQSLDLKSARLLSRRMNVWLYKYSGDNMQAADHDAVLAEVRYHRDVELAQFNHHIELRSTFPDDASFSQQWGLHNTGQTGGVADADIDAPEAWDLTTSGLTAYGDQIVVAVIDGGADLSHPDIDYFKNENEIPNNGIDDDLNGYIDDYDGWNVYGNNGSIPSHDHGTHVSGIAAAIGNNALGVSGVNWGVKVMPIAGSSTQEATVVAAYGYVLEMRSTYNETDGAAGAFVVATNSSFGVDYGDPDNFPIWCAAYDSMGEAGIISAAATANINLDIDVAGDVPTACASDYLLSITNTTNTDAKRTSAGYGLVTIDLGAPGTSVYSTTAGGGYGLKTGTSMATPHVAGAVAFMYANACPSLLELGHTEPGTVALLMKGFIMDGVDPNASLDGITVTGGRLNLFNSATLVTQYPCATAISHIPLEDTKDTLNDYEVVALILSDTTLVADSLLLHYQVGAIWFRDTMVATGAENEYRAYIAVQGPGTDINYYLYATDTVGVADTTETFSFRVIDYGLLLTPEIDSARSAALDTVWYDLTVTNDGVLGDRYALTVAGAVWPTTVWDASGTAEVTYSNILQGDDTYDFKVRVIIPTSVYGDVDSANISATSVGDPAFYKTTLLITTSEGEPLSAPFSDEFPDLTLDIAKWVQVSGVEVSTLGIGEPSPPYSINLNGNPAGRDTLVSQAIDLSSEIGPIVRYSYQRTGNGDSPETGDDLWVDYLDSTGTWQIVQQHLGSGADMGEFEEVMIPLPGDALHDGFRLRIRARGTSGAFDDWFVDDVFVGPPPPYDFEILPQAATQYAPSGDTALFPLTIINLGSNSDQYDLSDLPGAWPVSYYDSTGDNPISTTVLVAPTDSVRVIIKVAIPGSATMSEADTVDIYATSTGDPGLSEVSRLTTISSGGPGGFPWYEPFPEDSVHPTRWIANVGATVNTEALSPPSEPYALNLDGGIDTVISQPIDLDGESNVMLSYYYQRGGAGEVPDPDEDLWVEYKNDVGAWITLDQHLGSGPAMSTFELRSHALPIEARHNSFQIRIRSYGSCVDCDDWYVDDIRVTQAPSVAASPLFVDEVLSQGDSAVQELVVENAGPGHLDYTLFAIPVMTKQAAFHNLLQSGQVEPARRKYAEDFFDYDDLKGQDDPRSGIAVAMDAGGPDAFGYFWMDSDAPEGPVFDWVDVSGTGTDIAADLDDDNYGGPYSLGFDFPYYGATYNEIYIGSNGIIGFASDAMSSRFKITIPSASTPNNILAWLWDDLDITNGSNPGGQVYLDTSGERAVIQFVDFPEYSALVGDVITAEVILENDGGIVFQYLSIAPGFDAASCAVGIENSDGTDGLEVAFLTPYLKDSLAVRFEALGQWLTIGSPGGGLDAGQADTVDLSFYSGTLDTGYYRTDLKVTSNDPLNSSLSIPVSLTIEIPPSYICGDIDGNGEGPLVDDLTYLVAYLFLSGPPPPELEAANVDGVVGPGGPVDISDLTYLVAYLFTGGPDPIC